MGTVLRKRVRICVTVRAWLGGSLGSGFVLAWSLLCGCFRLLLRYPINPLEIKVSGISAAGPQ